MEMQLMYDGAALKNNEIDCIDLSVCLVAINEILKETNCIVNKNNATIKVKVKASFDTGCFKINFIIIHDVIKVIRDFFISDNTNAVVNAMEIFSLVFGGLGLVPLIRFLKGGNPDKIIESNDGNFIVYKDCKELKIEKKVYELYKSYKIRKAFEDLVSPVNKEGIDNVAIKIKNEKEFIDLADKENLYMFKAPNDEETKLDEEPIKFKTNITIINLSFKEGNKWFVDDGQSRFYVTVEDINFLSSIDSGNVEFAKNDMLYVEIRREQFYIENKKMLKTENYIEKVLKHNKHKQMNLPI